MVRQGTRDLLASYEDLDVVGELADGETLTGMVKVKHPDIVLLDLNLPGKNGLELLEELKKQFPELCVVMFTAHTDLQYIRRAVTLKADGYLSKTVTQQELYEALREVTDTQNRPVYSQDVRDKLAENGTEEASVKLTAREQEILLQVAQGQSNQDIAKELVISVKTVETHVANLMKKLGGNNRNHLTAYAYKQGLV